MTPTLRDQALQQIDSYATSGAFRRDLAALVACPGESQNPARADELRFYLSDLLQPRLRAAGFDCAIFDNPVAGGGPFLIARRIEDPDFPTVLSYGHGDVVHGMAGAWSEGRDPYTLEVDGDRLYGRGTADNKCQHLIAIASLEAVKRARGQLGFNVTLLIEMSEEVGSPGLAEFAESHRGDLTADVLIASDGPRLEAATPTIFLGARGAINFDLTVDLRDGAHHSGNWGGLLADPAVRLAHALATITDPRGQIRIDGWRPDSLSTEIRETLRDLPVGGADGPTPDPDWGETGLSMAERVYGWNSFAVLAMKSGIPEAPMNAISGQARATCQLRFVVGTEPDRILPDLRDHLDAHGFEDVTITADPTLLFRATRARLDHPWVAFVERAVAEQTGKTPHVLPNLGGSLPNEVFAETLGLPTIWIPHSYPGCCQHGPDEHALMSVCREGLGIMTRLWCDIGDGAPGGP